MEVDKTLILGSTSPRRQKIFKLMGIRFVSMPPLYKEVYSNKISKPKIPEYFSRKKALSLSRKHQRAHVISFDTVILFQNQIMGKPKNPEEAFKMLSALNGKSHLVLTGVSLALAGKILASETGITKVKFGVHSPKSLLKYCQLKEPLDKAGGYAIQGRGGQFIEKINGCYYNVVGVPMQITLKMLNTFSKGAK